MGCLLAREIKNLKNTFQVNHSVAAIAFMGEVAAVGVHHVPTGVGHHVADHHVALLAGHHFPAGVCHHVAVHHVASHHVAGHHVALLVDHVGVPVCWRPVCLGVSVTG